MHIYILARPRSVSVATDREVNLNFYDVCSWREWARFFFWWISHGRRFSHNANRRREKGFKYWDECAIFWSTLDRFSSILSGIIYLKIGEIVRKDFLNLFWYTLEVVLKTILRVYFWTTWLPNFYWVFGATCCWIVISSELRVFRLVYIYLPLL